MPKARTDLLLGGCLSTVIGTALIFVTILAVQGVTSTLPIGLVFTAIVGIGVSLAVLALLRLLERFRSG